MSKVHIFQDSCKGVDDCGICAFVCPKNLFETCNQMNEAGYYPPEITDPDECNGCQNCMICCPDYAIVVEKDATEPTHKQEDHDAAS